MDPPEALERFFQTPWLFYFDRELAELADILEKNSMPAWSRVPKLYFILRGIGHLHLMQSFVDKGLSDDSIPIEAQSVIPTISNEVTTESIRHFEELQNKIILQPYSIYHDHLEAYLNPKKVEDSALDDIDFLQIGRLLELCGENLAAKTPKLYYVLKTIGEIDALPKFHAQGYNDMWFPFPSNILRAPLLQGRTTKASFLKTQENVYSIRWSEDIHMNFATDEHDFLSVQKQLGTGGSGEVTHVYCRSFRKHYAQKLINRRDGLRVFANEVKMLKSVHHQHCVLLMCSYTDPDNLAILSYPVADMNLGTLLNAPAISFDRKQLLQSFFGCLSVAISYLHSRGIRHKDIKPQNILIHGNNVLLTDFGISADSAGVTTSMLGNTPRYNSPEFDDSGQRDEMSDIWSLGCVFFEILGALKGLSIADIKSYFRGRGTARESFNANPEAVKSWLSDVCSDEALISFGKMAVAARTLTSVMMSHAKHLRPTSQLLVQDFGKSLQKSRGSAIYGTCCREELKRAAEGLQPEDSPKHFVDNESVLGIGHYKSESSQGLSLALQQVMEPQSAKRAAKNEENDTTIRIRGQKNYKIINLPNAQSWDLEKKEEINYSLSPAEIDFPQRRIETPRNMPTSGSSEGKISSRTSAAATAVDSGSSNFKSHSQGRYTPVTAVREASRLGNPDQEVRSRLLPSAARDNDWEDVRNRVMAGTFVDEIDGDGNTAFIWAAFRGKLEMAKFLLANGANLKLANRTQNTALHIAAEKGDERMVKFLISKGANLAAKDKDGCTPLHVAESRRHIYVLELLLDAGAPIEAYNDRGDTVIDIALENMDERALDLLLERAPKGMIPWQRRR